MTPDAVPYLLVGAGLFALGAIGFLTRRNLIVMILSAEMMLHGVALTLVTFGHLHQTFEGQVFTIFGLTVAACEAGLALTLVLSLYRMSKSLDVQRWSELREPGLPPLKADLPDAPMAAADEQPHLTPAGLVPDSRRRTQVPPVTAARHDH